MHESMVGRVEVAVGKPTTGEGLVRLADAVEAYTKVQIEQLAMTKGLTAEECEGLYRRVGLARACRECGVWWKPCACEEVQR